MALNKAELDSRLRRWVGAVAVAASYGVIAGLWTPRGPLTTAEALIAMTLAALTGVAAGLATRSRWSLLVAPAVFALVFEIIRLRIVGPTVDGIHLGSTYGVIAFVTGRGLHGVLTLLPMALGATLAAAWTRRGSPSRNRGGLIGSAGHAIRLGVVVAATVSVLVLAAAVVRPATTDPILGDDGAPVAGSIAELTTADVGEHSLAMMIRGRDRTNPVLLFLAGGPGGSEFGAMRRHGQALEDDFVVATLDQRGAGSSYSQLDPADTLDLEGAVSDTIAVTDYLRDRFDQGKIYLSGQSWGTLLGVLAVQQRPELFHAYVGVGQMVSPLATDQRFYADTLAWATRTENAALVESLTRSGAPPYTTMLDYEAALSYEHEVYPYDHSNNSEGAGQMSENIFVKEYSFVDQVHLLGAFMDVFAVLYPQIQGVDLRTQATRLTVPVYVAQGRHEAPGRSAPAKEWFDLLEAPSKRLIMFDTSGHRPLWEQPAQFHELMLDRRGR